MSLLSWDSYLNLVPSSLWFIPCALLVLYTAYGKVSHRRYPPGPRPLPLVGNLKDMPTDRHWETYGRWAKEHGDLTCVRVFGSVMIFVNSERAIRDLMEKRADNTAGRPVSVWSDMLGEDWIFTMMTGEGHKERRYLVQKHFIGRVHSYRAIQTNEALRLMRNLLNQPEGFFEECSLFAARIVMMIGYGHAPETRSDPYLALAEKIIVDTGSSNFLVEAIPLLKFYPEWLPFSGFRKFARETAQLGRQARDLPFYQTKTQLAAGNAKHSFVASQLQEISGDRKGEQEEMIRDCAGVMYLAGTDTTSSTLTTFFAAMALNPEAQRNAQEEIDRVVGKDRLPTFADRDSLRYVDALVKEVFRWNCITPAGLPHRLLANDTYNGYFLPKDAMICGNLWALFNDPTTFVNPEHFNPERFMGQKGAHPREIVEWVFGWGKRACPGRYLAEASLFIAIALILASFNIGRAKDTTGKEYPLKAEWTSGFVRRPLPFKCSIVPRSKKTEALILETESEA